MSGGVGVDRRGGEDENGFADVKLQLGKKTKAAKSNRSDEYYDRYDSSEEQYPGPFAIFLKECEIVLQYTIPDKPNMNNVAK
ncbi:hypothetical protein CR513_34235, partial [Mucuna pruriens]